MIQICFSSWVKEKILVLVLAHPDGAGMKEVVHVKQELPE